MQNIYNFHIQYLAFNEKIARYTKKQNQEKAHNNRNRSMGKLDIRTREFTRELEPIERINMNIRTEIKTH